MGCASSKAGNESVEDNRNAEVNKQLQDSANADKFKYKILLLGAGESGKSTFSKQLRLIHKQAMTARETENATVALRYNVLDSMIALLEAMDQLNIPLSNRSLAASAARVLSRRDGKLNPKLAKEVQALWNDTGVQTAWSQREKFYFLDATPYYMAEAIRIADYDFQITDEDLIMSRVMTTGIKVATLTDPPFEFSVVDVGGQRNERKKWIHIFDDVKAIVFVVSLAGFNQVLFEDVAKNRMKESLELFEEVVSNPLFKSTNFFLLLNKKDLFEVEIKRTNLKNYFPEYHGPSHEVAPAIDFIEGNFHAIMAKWCPGKTLHTCVMAARVRMECRQGWNDIVRVIKSTKRQSSRLLPQRNYA